MPVSLTVVPPLLVAAVFITSGIGKIRRPDDLVSWADLGVPAALRRKWLLTFHPWGEVALGAALVLLGGVLGELAAIIALALMVGYLVFVARVVRSGTDASCACFGARKRITVATVVRNSWYVLLALAAVATAWVHPTWGGPVASLDATGWVWMLGLAATAVTVAVTMWPTPADDAAALPVQTISVPSGDEGELDYLRSRTPAVPVTLADGTDADLRTLSMTGRPLLTLHVSPGCGSCVVVHERLAEIRAALPEVSVRLLLNAMPDDSEWTERSDDQSLHDPHGYVRRSLSDGGTPTAVLFGLDGLLAGGPILGSTDVFDFIDDIYESLHGERPEKPFGDS